MTQQSQSQGGGIGFVGLLFIVFLVLKLTHVINWSWWFVTMPLWGGFAVMLIIWLVALTIVAVMSLFER